jgi:hypothetical protein
MPAKLQLRSTCRAHTAYDASIAVLTCACALFCYKDMYATNCIGTQKSASAVNTTRLCDGQHSTVQCMYQALSMLVASNNTGAQHQAHAIHNKLANTS